MYVCMVSFYKRFAEYGMDSILYGDQYQNSPIFNEDWFGQANPLNSKHEIDTGRWSKIKMPSGSYHTYIHVCMYWCLMAYHSMCQGPSMRSGISRRPAS